jgi:tetratricopeptide (TPR) repeat protein
LECKRGSLLSSALKCAILGCALWANLGYGGSVQAATALDQGIRAYNAGKYDEAIGRLGQAESTEFNNPILHYYLANALAKTKQTPDAIKEYKVALALEPNGQLADYCRQALQAMGALPAEDKPKRRSRPPLDGLIGQPMTYASSSDNSQARLPQIIALLCGCPLCQRLQLILADLQAKYGTRISFAQSRQGAADPAVETMLSRFQSHGCPEILFVDGRGIVTNHLQGTIAESELYRNTEAILASSPTDSRAPAPVGSDERNKQMAASIAQEAEARISQNRKRLESDIQRLQDEQNRSALEASYGRRSGGYYYQTDVSGQIRRLRAEFKRSEDEIREAAKERIKSLTGSSGQGLDYPTADLQAPGSPVRFAK